MACKNISASLWLARRAGDDAQRRPAAPDQVLGGDARAVEALRRRPH